MLLGFSSYIVPASSIQHLGLLGRLIVTVVHGSPGGARVPYPILIHNVNAKTGEPFLFITHHVRVASRGRG